MLYLTPVICGLSLPKLAMAGDVKALILSVLNAEFAVNFLLNDPLYSIIV